MQIVDSRWPSAVTGTCLTVSKQVFDSLVLLVDSKLKYFVAIYTQPCLTTKKVEMKTNHR